MVHANFNLGLEECWRDFICPRHACDMHLVDNLFHIIINFLPSLGCKAAFSFCGPFHCNFQPPDAFPFPFILAQTVARYSNPKELTETEVRESLIQLLDNLNASLKRLDTTAANVIRFAAPRRN